MSGSSENPSKQTVKPVTAATEVREFLCAVPRQHADSRETWLRRAGAFFGLTPRRAKSIWYGEKVRIDYDEFMRMRARLEQLKRAQMKRQEILNDAAILLAQARNDARRVAGGTGQAVGSRKRA